MGVDRGRKTSTLEIYLCAVECRLPHTRSRERARPAPRMCKNCLIKQANMARRKLCMSERALCASKISNLIKQINGERRKYFVHSSARGWSAWKYFIEFSCWRNKLATSLIKHRDGGRGKSKSGIIIRHKDLHAPRCFCTRSFGVELR